jgi:hypothetical protein
MLGHCLRKETTEISVAKDVKYRTIHRRAHQKGHSTKYKLWASVRTSTRVLRMRGEKTLYSPFQTISNKMQGYTVYLYLETALHVSGGTSTHHQERIQFYLQHQVFVTPVTAICRYPASVGAVPTLHR